MHALRILLVDVREVIHVGFKHVLFKEEGIDRFEVARNRAEATAVARALRPDVAIVGVTPEREDVAEVCRSIGRESPDTKLLLVAGDTVSSRRALAMGASGVVPRTWRGPEILGAARTVAGGLNVFVPETDRATGLLTSRELEILELIGEGATNREIAASIGLSANTIKDHTSTLYKKIKARNRAEAIARAERMGLLA